MQCPGCQSNTLFPSFLEDSLRSHHCKSCGGNWLLIEDYISWLERGETEPSSSTTFEVEDTKTALICPLSGAIMQKFRINNDADHKLDYSARVGGVWLDAGEWEYLKENGLATSLNRIFTDHWQKQLRDNDTKSTFEDLYVAKFGEQDYQRAKEVRAWLSASDQRADLRAYLLAEDPYKT